jgi:tight adherence protein B
VIATVIVAIAVVVAAIALRPRPRRLEPTPMHGPTRLDVAAAAWTLRRSRRRTPDARGVASWCDDIVRHVRSGSTLREALTVVPDDPATARATTPLRLAIDRGLSIPDAVGRVGDEGSHVRLALGVIVATGRIGGPAAAAIDRTAMALRQRAADLDERSTHAAQARLSTHVMTAVPLLMLGVLIALDAEVRSVVAAPIGAVCIATGLLLNVAGWWWMHRIVGAST